ncbi:MAG TPA: sigma-70 family RNA polymerase sigma factor [Saprospiraceae bacterium]|nr:sigma-70 family RNA polymerase sigma factor [Saprospiraceae bacterium]
MNLEPNIHSKDEELFKGLKSGDMKIYDNLYLLYREDFLRTAKHKFGAIPEADIVDAWQDSVISFFEQISSGKLISLSCTIKSFLYLVGFRYILKTHKKKVKTDSLESFFHPSEDLRFVEEMELKRGLNEEQELLNIRINELPEQSKRILLLRYVEGKSISEITKEMKYQSENSVSVTLSRTLKKLKELLEKDIKY